MQYSPSRRTALVLCGTGAHGAYHAGVLRALQEAGVKIDVVAGEGVGAAGAVLAAIDGGSRLWEADGIWRSEKPGRFYDWTPGVRIVQRSVLAIVTVLILSLIALLSVGMSRMLWDIVAVVVAAAMVTIGVTLVRTRWRPGARRASGRAWWSVGGAPAGRRRHPVRASHGRPADGSGYAAAADGGDREE